MALLPGLRGQLLHIGAAWLAHNAITEYLERADAAFVRLNLLLLLSASLLPRRWRRKQHRR